MIQKSSFNKRDVERLMNLALDDSLPEPAESALRAHLAESPSDALLYNRMRDVDNLFANAGMVQAPSDFASKVMLSIAAQTQSATGKAPARVQRTGTGAALGLLLAFLLMVPLAALGITAVQRWFSDPAALNTLMQQFVLMLNNLAQAIASASVIATYTIDKPVLPALLTTTIPLTMIWGWFMWYTSMRRQQVVYRIPVSVA